MRSLKKKEPAVIDLLPKQTLVAPSVPNDAVDVLIIEPLRAVTTPLALLL